MSRVYWVCTAVGVKTGIEIVKRNHYLQPYHEHQAPGNHNISTPYLHACIFAKARQPYTIPKPPYVAQPIHPYSLHPMWPIRRCKHLGSNHLIQVVAFYNPPIRIIE